MVGINIGIEWNVSEFRNLLSRPRNYRLWLPFFEWIIIFRIRYAIKMMWTEKVFCDLAFFSTLFPLNYKIYIREAEIISFSVYKNVVPFIKEFYNFKAADFYTLLKLRGYLSMKPDGTVKYSESYLCTSKNVLQKCRCESLLFIKKTGEQRWWKCLKSLKQRSVPL